MLLQYAVVLPHSPHLFHEQHGEPLPLATSKAVTAQPHSAARSKHERMTVVTGAICDRLKRLAGRRPGLGSAGPAAQINDQITDTFKLSAATRPWLGGRIASAQ